MSSKASPIANDLYDQVDTLSLLRYSVTSMIDEPNRPTFSSKQYIHEIYSLTCMEDDFRVTLSDQSVRAESPHLGIEEVQWNQLKKISIVTNDKGPFTADVFLVFLSDTGGCAVPQGNTKYQALYDKVTAFENINFENIIKAMSSANNNEFVIWESN